MALPQKVFIFNVSSIGSGQYTFEMYIQNPSFEKYVKVGDTVEDTANNRYTVDTWATFPTDFSDGTVVTVTFETADVAPVEDVDYNSDWYTEGLEDIRPQVQTNGTLSGITVYSGQNFEYELTGTWDSTTEAYKAVVGDYVVDSSGKFYEITFIDGASKFSVPFRMKEIEQYGDAPNAGLATLFRPTSNYGYFTGKEFSEIQRAAVRNRDNFLQDKQGILGLPSSGDYGDPVGNVSGVQQSDRVEDAFDKVEEVLAKLAPEKPEDLSLKTLSISGTYSAYESGAVSPTLRTNVIDNAQPVASTPNTASEGFYDATQGTLTALVNTVDEGNRVLSTADDTGVYSALTIIDDFDFHLGTAGKENFWYALIASVQATSPLSLGENTYQLTHSITGSTPLYTFYVDNPATPSIATPSITGSGTGTYISGVPSLDVGDTITADFTVNNAVGQHYNSTRIARAQSSYTSDANQALPGTPPSSGASIVASIPLTVENNKYIENVPITCIGYNSKGGTSQQNVFNNIRIDTISNESPRSKSGQGQFPTLGSTAAQFGDPFVSTESLATAGNEELQLLNGTYGYPSGNYTLNTPTAGPNYTSVPNGTYNNFRWVTFNLGSIVTASAITLNFTSTQNFGGSTLISNFALYVLVNGALPTVGWIDGNAAYPGVGDPTNNGDPALVIGSSTVTSKRVTFGTSVKTGDVWVRIGIPTGGDNKRFASVNLV